MRALRAPAPRAGAARPLRRAATRCCAPAAPQPVKRDAWPVTLRMTPTLTVPLPPATSPPDEGCSLAAYMTLPTAHYVLLPLPLGATLTRLAAGSLFALTIPRVQLFSLAVKPSIHVAVDVVAQPSPPQEPLPCVRIAAADAFVEGEWAQQLGLNALFEIYGTTRFTWSADAITSTTGALCFCSLAPLRCVVSLADVARVQTCAWASTRRRRFRASRRACWFAWATRCWAPSARSCSASSSGRWLRTTARGPATRSTASGGPA